jgi:lipoprotein-anchoring transpeptidase ErfK/SrfK
MNDTELLIDIANQTLSLSDHDAILRHYKISTARNGPGERFGSECTPRGRHRIRARIGAGCPAGTVFVARRPTGETYSPALRAAHPDRDWILTRILWLSGLEPGRNRFGNVDTMRRYIYIHGSPDDVPMGTPGSHGCIRMRNDDIMELFELTRPGMPVLIR